MPLYGGMSAILFFASMGLPGLCGFVGEVFVVLGAVELLAGAGDSGDAERGPDGRLPALDVAARVPGHEPGDRELPRLSAREAVVLIVVLRAGDRVWACCPRRLCLNWMEPSVTGQVEALARLKP